MRRSCNMDEILGSSASETFVRSTYEIVYIIRATGMMRNHRCGIIGRMLSQSAVRRKDYVISRFCCGFETDRWIKGGNKVGFKRGTNLSSFTRTLKNY